MTWLRYIIPHKAVDSEGTIAILWLNFVWIIGGNDIKPYRDPFKWPAIALTVLFVALLLGGCATLKDDEDFMQRTASANATPSPNYEPMVLMVEGADDICRRLGSVASKDTAIRGCAEYEGRIVPERCLVIVDVQAPAWTLFHEKLHCKYGRWHK